MGLIIDAAGQLRLPPTSPPPFSERIVHALKEAVEKAVRAREEAGGEDRLQADELPHQVQPGDTITDISNTYEAALPEVIESNPQIENPNLIFPNEVVFVPIHDPEIIETREEVLEAEEADRSVTSLEALRDNPDSSPASRQIARIELETARPYADEQWAEVKDAVTDELLAAGEGEALPDEATASLVDEIRRRAPESGEFQTVVDEALADALEIWGDEGRTSGQLGEVLDRYDELKAAQDELDAARADPSTAAATPYLEEAVSAAEDALQQEIESQLLEVTNEVPIEEQEEAFDARIQIISDYGPDDAAFRDIVDRARYDVLVQPHIDAVETAFDQDGAGAAAEALNDRTSNVSPKLAEEIVLGSMPTIDKIAEELVPTIDAEALENQQEIFQDLATVVEHASQSPTGQQALDAVTDRIVHHLIGDDASNAVLPTYIEDEIHPGDGTKLSAAVSAELRLVQTNEEIAEAEAASQGIESLEELRDNPDSSPGMRRIATIELETARPYAAEQWAEVQDLVSEELLEAGEGEPLADEATSELVYEIRDRAPDSEQFQTIVDEALADAMEIWGNQGRTSSQLGEVLNRYEDVEAAQAALDAARDDPSAAAAIPYLARSVATAEAALEEEIESQLFDVADKVPPEEQEGAVIARALLISDYGSQDAQFQDIVGEALYDVLVQPRIDTVEAAFDQGGAEAAAEALNEQTADVSPKLAEQVVLGSMPVVDKITEELGASVAPDYLTGSYFISDFDGFESEQQIFRDLAVAADRASQSPTGQPAVDAIANSLVQHIGDDPSRNFGLRLYIEDAVPQGEAAALSVAIVAELDAQGYDLAAEDALWSIRLGVNNLNDGNPDAIEDFVEATETIVRLHRDWGGMMTPEQLESATEAYVTEHPEILEDFNRTYAEIEDQGYASARTLLALNDSALDRLSGIDGYERLVEARNNLANADETALVMAESASGRNEIAQAALTADAIDIVYGSSGSDPGSSAGYANRGRGVIKEFGNSYVISVSSNGVADVQDFFGNGTTKLDPKKFSNFGLSMNGLGVAFNGLSAYSAISDFVDGKRDFAHSVKTLYYSVGTGKEFAELLAGAIVRLNGPNNAPVWAGSVVSKSNKVSIFADQGIVGGTRAFPAHIRNQPGWVKFSTFLKFAGGAIDAGFAINSATKGDWTAAGLYGTSAVGGGLMGLASAGAIGSWGGPVGAGLAIVGTAGLYLYNDAKNKARFEGPSREFLEAAGYSPEVANLLANYSDVDGQSAGPAIVATAAEFGVNPETLMETLNELGEEHLDEIEDLVSSAYTVDPNENGNFPLTAENDYEVWGPGGKDPQFGGEYLYDPENTTPRGTFRGVGGSPYPVLITDPNPRSMTALRDYARALFGQPVLG